MLKNEPSQIQPRNTPPQVAPPPRIKQIVSSRWAIGSLFLALLVIIVSTVALEYDQRLQTLQRQAPNIAQTPSSEPQNQRRLDGFWLRAGDKNEIGEYKIVDTEFTWAERYGIALNVTPGRQIIAMLISHDEKSIVYVETEPYDNSGYIRHHNYLMDTESGKVCEIANGLGLSGACPSDLLPIAWSKNDKRIIFKLFNLSEFGSGCFPFYWYYSLNPSSDLTSASFKKIGSLDGNFYDDNTIFVDPEPTEETERSNQMPMAVSGMTDRFAYYNIETEKRTILSDISSTSYLKLTNYCQNLTELNGENLSFNLCK